MKLTTGSTVVWAPEAQASADEYGPGPFIVTHRTTKPPVLGMTLGAYLTLEAPDGSVLRGVEFPEDRLTPYEGEKFVEDDIVNWIDPAAQRAKGRAPGPLRVLHVKLTGRGILLTLGRIGAGPGKVRDVSVLEIMKVGRS